MRAFTGAILMSVALTSPTHAEIKCNIPDPHRGSLGPRLLEHCLKQENMTYEEWQAQFPASDQREQVRQVNVSWPDDFPNEMKVPRVLCLGYPMVGVGFMHQLPAGGTWKRIDSRSFRYAATPVDPATDHRNDIRYLFVRGDDTATCGDTAPCAILTRVVFNGADLDQRTFAQVCSALGKAGALYEMNLR